MKRTSALHPDQSPPLVSLIIPVYNGAFYIEDCIASILEQTYAHFEVIFINDGSTDASEALIAQAMQKDSRIRLLTQQHAGQAAARNRGLQAAKGDFISFPDADDLLLPTMLESLLHLALSEGVDIAICNMAKFRDFQLQKYSAPGVQASSLSVSLELASLRDRLSPYLQYTSSTIRFLQWSDRAHFIEEYLSSGVYENSVANKLYRKTLLDQFACGFTSTELVFAEDLLFNAKCLLYANGIAAVDSVLYLYRTHEHSFMASEAHHTGVQTRACRLTVHLLDEIASALMGLRLSPSEQQMLLFAVKVLFYRQIHQAQQIMLARGCPVKTLAKEIESMVSFDRFSDIKALLAVSGDSRKLSLTGNLPGALYAGSLAFCLRRGKCYTAALIAYFFSKVVL